MTREIYNLKFELISLNGNIFIFTLREKRKKKKKNKKTYLNICTTNLMMGACQSTSWSTIDSDHFEEKSIMWQCKGWEEEEQEDYFNSYYSINKQGYYYHYSNLLSLSLLSKHSNKNINIVNISSKHKIILVEGYIRESQLINLIIIPSEITRLIVMHFVK